MVGAAVGGAVVGRAVVGAAVCVAVGDGLGAAVVGGAVRVTVLLGDGDAEGLGDGDAVAPAKRDSPPPRITAISRSMSRPPATAARIKSIQRGPRRGGGAMICVVSDIGRANRRLYAGWPYAPVPCAAAPRTRPRPNACEALRRLVS